MPLFQKRQQPGELRVRETTREEKADAQARAKFFEANPGTSEAETDDSLKPEERIENSAWRAELCG